MCWRVLRKRLVASVTDQREENFQRLPIGGITKGFELPTVVSNHLTISMYQARAMSILGLDLWYCRTQ